MSSRPLSRQWRRNGFDLERERQAVVVGERAGFQIGRQLVAGMGGGAVEQVVDLLLR